MDTFGNLFPHENGQGGMPKTASNDDHFPKGEVEGVEKSSRRFDIAEEITVNGRNVESLQDDNRRLQEQNTYLKRELEAARLSIQGYENQILEKNAEIERHKDTAETDELTGLPNRRAFKKKFEEIKSWNERSLLKGYSILAFDLDGFKAINDKFGHAVGDLCLKIVAQEVKNVLRSSDFFAREGGDEFLVLLPEVSEHGARIVGEKVLAAIEHTVAERLQDELGRGHVDISASVGVVGFGDKTGEKDVDEKDMIEIADYIRYVVKAAGKRAVLTLKEAHLCDSNGALWKQFLKDK